jgi:hypothetical protein
MKNQLNSSTGTPDFGYFVGSFPQVPVKSTLSSI